MTGLRSAVSGTGPPPPAPASRTRGCPSSLGLALVKGQTTLVPSTPHARLPSGTQWRLPSGRARVLDPEGLTGDRGARRRVPGCGPCAVSGCRAQPRLWPAARTGIISSHLLGKHACPGPSVPRGGRRVGPVRGGPCPLVCVTVCGQQRRVTASRTQLSTQGLGSHDRYRPWGSVDCRGASWKRSPGEGISKLHNTGRTSVPLE